MAGHQDLEICSHIFNHEELKETGRQKRGKQTEERQTYIERQVDREKQSDREVGNQSDKDR